MQSPETQELVRVLITEADHLSRTAHEANDHTRSGRFAALRSTLLRVERRLGGDAPRFALAGDLDVVYQRIRDLVSGGQPDESGHTPEDLALLLAHASRLRTAARTAPSREPSPPRSPPRASDHRPRLLSLTLAVGATAALVAPLVRRTSRRSRSAWVISAVAALASITTAAALELSRP